MISPAQLAEAYARNVSIVKMQTDGLSQAESLLQLPFRSNCINWIVGHLVTNRHSVLQLLQSNPPMEAERVTRYTRESDPIRGEQDDVLPLAEWLMFFYFHDTYHTGQTEILRQAAGRDDKII
jgi:uncharacterized damage-inducible protein DinB